MCVHKRFLPHPLCSKINDYLINYLRNNFLFGRMKTHRHTLTHTNCIFIDYSIHARTHTHTDTLSERKTKMKRKTKQHKTNKQKIAKMKVEEKLTCTSIRKQYIIYIYLQYILLTLHTHTHQTVWW